MQSLTIVLGLLSAGSVVAHQDNGTASTKAQCQEISQLTALTNLAANQTLLDKITQDNATRASAIQAKASAAATQLSTLTSNTTLVSACQAIFAVQTMQASCAKMAELERLQALVANSTELASKTHNNATRASALQAEASADASELTAMQSNATLTAFCANEQTKETCRAMDAMQKEINAASNSTLVSDRFNGNATEIAAFQAQVAKIQTRLTALQSNSTLTSVCAAANTTNTTSGNNTSTDTSAASAATTSTKSGGVMNAQPVDALVALAVLLFTSVMLL